MTYFYWEFPTDLSIDRRVLVLYDISQWKTVEKSYESFEKLCITLGIENISFSDFEWWFDHFTKENYYRIIDGRCVQSDVINGKSQEKSYNDLREAFGDVDEKSHSYWYKEFERQKHQVTFSKLPIDIVVKIVEKCDLRSHVKLRKVSQGLRIVVDRIKPPITEIEVKCMANDVFVCFNKESLMSTDSPWKRLLALSMIHNKKYVRIDPADLVNALIHPKLRLNFFRFQTNFSWTDVLQRLSIQIHVKHCSIGVLKEEYILEILRILRPGSLEKLTIESDLGLPLIDQRANMLYRQSIFEKVVQMDQWKRAKHVEIIRRLSLPIENFFHLTTFETHLPSISVEMLTKMISALSKSSNFEYCFVTTKERMDSGSIERELNLQDADDWGIHHIPNTNLSVKVFDHLHGFKLTKNV
ncbi:hypothetical protein GCK72_009239 [Caenorhabditis remanei]|uniref:F-box domain-containing protein n=1 Tax=Caenorhabditis remanei TaxID=31234 RepID=A0A6A5H2D6_CAERE|nr:hypothetical protein GCK72_009239 [Caenorhabditis remanei]KAF1760986.1 hypothetical protein GCK72_009239 [Caenorhabditis remanei]